MDAKKYNPWEKLDADLGSAQAGTFVGSRTDEGGITAKVIADDVCVNEPLAPPPDMDNAVLVGGVNLSVKSGISYKPVIKDGNRMRTCEITIRTLVSPLTPGTYGKGATKPNTSPESNAGNSLPKM